MRIIGGDLGGRWYKARKDPGVRPISGRIKQSLFDIIKGLVPGSKFLDLYAGTGAVGIEALSRGADFVFFIDSDRGCVEALSQTIEKMGLSARARVHPGNAMNDLSWVPFRGGQAQFDLIFMGPPYKDLEKRPLSCTTATLERLAQAKLLKPEGLIISQHHVKEDVRAPAGYELFRRMKYGDTYLDFWRQNSQSEA